jgi:hypothetical protein
MPFLVTRIYLRDTARLARGKIESKYSPRINCPQYSSALGRDGRPRTRMRLVISDLPKPRRERSVGSGILSREFGSFEMTSNNADRTDGVA